MIISASYRTDIPGFYGRWFMNRLGAGYCLAVNPYNFKPIRIALTREAVEGFVFWTKNLGPFVKYLPEVRGRGFPFVVQYAINGYPRELERSVADWQRSAEVFVETAERFGPRVCVWRYDTIVTTSLTPVAWHVERFGRIAEKLAGATDEVIISFAQIYAKTRRNMDEAAGEFGFTWGDSSDEEKCGLAEQLVRIAGSYGMRLSLCSQKKYVVAGAQAASCVDARRLAEGESGGVRVL
jgi:hypothetical protein